MVATRRARKPAPLGPQPNASNTILSYARIIKPTTSPDDTPKPCTEPAQPASPLSTPTSSKKRKNTTPDEPAPKRPHLSSTTPQKSIRTFTNQQSLPTPDPTPTHARTRSPSPVHPIPCSLSTSTPPPLPQPLQHLLTLSTALLRALTLHAAHHATSTPIDLHSLVQPTARIWGHATPSLPLLRQVLHLLHAAPAAPGFQLVDYGTRLCLELDPIPKDANAAAAPRWADARLASAVHRDLRTRWTRWTADRAADADAFLAALPLLAATSIPALHPRPARSAKLASLAPAASTPATRSTPPAASLTARSSALRARLATREAAAAPRQSPVETARLAALRRLERMGPVLAAMGARGGRRGVPRGECVRQVRESVGGWSREEVEGSLGVMGEVGGGWCRVEGKVVVFEGGKAGGWMQRVREGVEKMEREHGGQSG